MSNTQKSKVEDKLNRAEGQIKAIKKMLSEDRDCLEIVTQIAAARNALSSVARDLLTEEACMCATSPQKQKDLNLMLKKLFDFS